MIKREVLLAIEDYIKICVDCALDAEENSYDMRSEETKAKEASYLESERQRLYKALLETLEND